MSKPFMQVAASKLLRALRLAGQVTERKNTVPILDYLLIDARDGAVRVTATDLDCEFSQSVEAEVDAPTTLALPTHKLLQIASTVPKDAFLRFTLSDNDRVSVTSGKIRFVLPSMAVKDFPRFPEMTPKGALDINAEQLAVMLSRTVPFVAAHDDHRYYLTGPYWHGVDGCLTIAATSGYVAMQVAAREIDWPDGAPNVILSAKAAKVMQSLAVEGGLARVEWDTRRARLILGDAVVDGKVIDGQFVNYARLLDPGETVPCHFNCADMREAAKRLSIAADQSSNAIKLEPKGDEVSLSMRSAESQVAASEDVACEVGGLMRCAFNVKYLDAVLSALGGEVINLQQKAPGEPAVFQSAVANGAIAVIMPMTV